MGACYSCNHCGKCTDYINELKGKCIRCHAEVPAGATRCPECGAPLPPPPGLTETEAEMSQKCQAPLTHFAAQAVKNLLKRTIVRNGWKTGETRGNLLHSDLVQSCSKKFGHTLAYGWRQVEQMFHNDNRLSWWLSNLSSNTSE